MKKNLIGCLVRGYPDPEFIGIIYGFDYAISRYLIHWFSWGQGGSKSNSYWNGTEDGDSAIESNIIKTKENKNG